ncbi:glycosyltransferase family 2 protein [Nocardiopsis oceani]
MPSLSVIIPAKDVEPYIGDTLNSLVRNDRPDFEYIVVNDGSSDRTPEIVDAFRQRLPNLRILHNEHPTGLSAARNQGLQESSGRYITYLDGDDWLAPGYLPKAVDATAELGVDFARTDLVEVYPEHRVQVVVPEGRTNRPLDPRTGILPNYTRSAVDHPYACTGIYSRHLVDQGLLTFDTNLLTCEDRPWIWRLHLNAKSYARLPMLGVFYRREVPGSLTQVGDRRQLHFFDAFDQVVDMVSTDRDAHRYLPKALHTYCKIMHRHINRKQRLSPTLQRTLIDRAAATLRRLPPALLDVVLRELSSKEEQRLRELHASRAPRGERA